MRFILFIKEQCPFCVTAQELLTSRNFDFKTVSFESDQTETLNEIKEAYNWPTVPMIFLRDGNNIEFIGGCTDLEKRLSKYG